MKYFLVILFFFVKLLPLAQTPVSYNFSDENDFSPKTIFYMYEDKKRNIWFGTNEGLIKWNGSTFKNYININYSSSYSSIQEDSTGRIWCLNFTGQLFYIENDSLKLFSNDNKLILTTFDYSVHNYPLILLTSNYGLIEYDFFTKDRIIHNKGLSILQKNHTNDSLSLNLCKHLVPYKKGLVYWSNNKLKLKYEGASGKVLFNVPDIFNEQLPQIIPVNSKLLLIDNEGKVLDINNDSLRNINTPHKINTSSILFDDKNNLFFIGTTNGLIVLNKLFQPVYRGNILEGNNISHILLDKEGNYWISTLNNGVFIVPSLYILEHKSKIIQPKKIYYIIKDRNDTPYFIEKYGNIYMRDNTNILKQIGSFNERVEHITYNPYRNEICAGNLKNSFNLITHKLIHNIYGGDIKSVTYLDSNVILTSTSGSSNLRGSYLHQQKSPLSSILSNDINYIFNTNEEYFVFTLRAKRSTLNTVDYKNKVAYIAYSDGLFYYKNGIEQELMLESVSLLISTLSKPQDGVVWATTINNELLKIENGKIIDVIKLETKVKNLKVWKTYLFINTLKGILKFNTLNEKKNWINKIDGLPSNDIFNIEIINDKVYAATTNGVVEFDCNYSYINKQKPLVELTNVAIWEKDTVLTSTYFLNHDQNNITFYFNANSNRSRNSYIYTYRMLGIDSTWLKQESKINFARFPIIPPGNYTFQVKSINEDGIESDISEIELIIEKPYYQKWWFYTLIGFLIVILVSTVFMIRINVLKKQNTLINDKKDIEKQLSQSQLMALRSQMNPHFIFNALNSIQDYIITNNKELASDYLGLFADLMRKYLHYSNEDEITLEEEIETLDMYLQLEKVRFEETLIYSINVDEKLDTIRVKIPVMLIQPFAENAIKHGLLHKKGKRLLEISLRQKNQHLIISIEDNGIGRKQSAEINKMRNRSHKSFATSAQQKRIDLINQENSNKIHIKYTDLEDSLKQSIGTLVEVRIPLT